jgi:cytochrome c oxidase assembly protein subunit 15
MPHAYFPPMSRPVTRLAWTTLIANLFVILWGAWVRASGSGAGCGNHWPTCNGVILPQSPTMHTIVEFTHRVSSGIAVLLIVVMVIAAWRTFPKGHRARAAALASLILICVEAGIGAGLVKFELVASNATLARGISLGIHLVNTQFLLTAIALTAWFAAGHGDFSRDRMRQWRTAFVAAFIGLILVGMAGAMASLGDTLFPARTLAEGMAQDSNPALNVLLHIRVWHPVLAILTGIGVILLASRVMHHDDRLAVRRAAIRVHVAVATQWCLGVLSLVLLVPVALQLLHLLTADLVWLSVVWLGVNAVTDD